MQRQRGELVPATEAFHEQQQRDIFKPRPDRLHGHGGTCNWLCLN